MKALKIRILVAFLLLSWSTYQIVCKEQPEPNKYKIAPCTNRSFDELAEK